MIFFEIEQPFNYIMEWFYAFGIVIIVIVICSIISGVIYYLYKRKSTIDYSSSASTVAKDESGKYVDDNAENLKTAVGKGATKDDIESQDPEYDNIKYADTDEVPI